MAIIDALEGAARGVYSGCVGFISLNDCFDLNVVIRTAVVDSGASLRHTPAQTPGAALPTDQEQTPGAALSTDQTQTAGSALPTALSVQAQGNTLASAPAAAAADTLAGAFAVMADAAGEGAAGAGSGWTGRGGQGQGCGGDWSQWEGWQRALLSIGAGGAIVVQSDTEGEFEEMCLKARALRAAVGRCDGGGEGEPAGLDTEHAWGT